MHACQCRDGVHPLARSGDKSRNGGLVYFGRVLTLAARWVAIIISGTQNTGPIALT